MGLLIRFARQWVAGEHLEDAVRATRDANALNIGGIVNLLGEHHREKGLVDRTLREYLRILDHIERDGLDASVSIKPSQFGLAFGRPYCESQVLPLYDRVRSTGGFLWLDMEGSAYTDDTLAIYEDLLRRDPNVGVCLQANLRRTRRDLERLLELGGKIRLTKGAYREPRAIAFTSRAEVDAAFGNLLRTLFARGERFGVATHDARFVEQAVRLGSDQSRTWEFQMLMGVRDPLKRELVRQGFRVLEYIPYGTRWLPYFARRLRERPRNVFAMVRSLVQG